MNNAVAGDKKLISAVAEYKKLNYAVAGDKKMISAVAGYKN